MNKKLLSFLMITLVMVMLAVVVYFIGLYDDEEGLNATNLQTGGSDVIMITGQNDELGSISSSIMRDVPTTGVIGQHIGQTEQVDSTEDIGLGDAYTSPWFADIDLIAGRWIAVYPQSGGYIRQQKCWMGDVWENGISFFTTDDVPTKNSPWFMWFMARKLDEYRIVDFRYDGSDRSRFVLEMIDEHALKKSRNRLLIYKKSYDMIEIQDQEDMLDGRYVRADTKDDYTMSECVEE